MLQTTAQWYAYRQQTSSCCGEVLFPSLHSGTIRKRTLQWDLLFFFYYYLYLNPLVFETQFLILLWLVLLALTPLSWASYDF